MSLPVSTAPVLVTGFEPFAGAASNPSWRVAQALHGHNIGGIAIVAACLPTAFGQSLVRLRALLDNYQPQMLVCLGLAGGRSAICIERIAINLIDARIPDNEGEQPIDVPVVAGAVAAYFSTLPIKTMCRAIRALGIPSEISHSAGTFVCNQVMYGGLHMAHASGKGMRAGFIHLPWATGEGVPSLDDNMMVAAIEEAIAVALECPCDVREVGGSIY
ncbi:pyroglutamyl-peptidase I [Lampropedia puyangensis]|uniref:Pyroglutamyl-peptidase I n=1 Tax=Lampropedia puyangensis TaxID=1330072 RepID=A0A4S8F0X5_9BURK|nr:pyroglutamyl-peptidase I [Lampropedia puyangensis]THT98741.1 pyroglutamyl-peptidase I [Lampropedia puyangensis]